MKNSIIFESIDSEQKITTEYLNLKTYKFENKSAVKLEIYWYDGHSVSVDTNTNKTQFKFKHFRRK